MKNYYTLLCPVCRDNLTQINRTYTCVNGHSFDISRKGYVNLLMGNSSGHHGDDKLMVRARTAFLNRGYYDRLSDEICRTISGYYGNELFLIDAGCGEGKYLSDLLNYLKKKEKRISALAVDISKDAVSALCSRTREADAVVASTSSLPVSDHSADVLLNIFAPFFAGEFYRVLKPEGILIRVVPLENHLVELKRAVYDNIYLNSVPDYQECGFSILEKREVRYQISVPNSEDLHNLFLMTPYYYKTSAEDQKKLNALDNLDITLEFLIIIYKKTGK